MKRLMICLCFALTMSAESWSFAEAHCAPGFTGIGDLCCYGSGSMIACYDDECWYCHDCGVSPSACLQLN